MSPAAGAEDRYLIIREEAVIMATIAGCHIPEPKDEKEFEEMVVDYARIFWYPNNFSLYGRPGQKQDGVDVIGTVLISGVPSVIAYQCKNMIGGVSNKLITDEAQKVINHPIPINRLIIATTAPTDRQSQIHAWSIWTGSSPLVNFKVDIIFWDDIVSVLSSDLSIFQKHYPQIQLGVQGKSDHDKYLLEGIINIFGRSGTIDFLRDYDIGSGISGDRTNHMSEFYHQWNTSDRTFKDTNLEVLRKELYDSNKAYLLYISTNFFSSGGWYSAKHLRDTNPAKYKEIIDTLHKMGDTVRESYDALVIAGR